MARRMQHAAGSIARRHTAGLSISLTQQLLFIRQGRESVELRIAEKASANPNSSTSLERPQQFQALWRYANDT